jgi:hypothetical protein
MFISDAAMQALLEPCEGELGCVLWDDAVRRDAKKALLRRPILASGYAVFAVAGVRCRRFS